MFIPLKTKNTYDAILITVGYSEFKKIGLNYFKNC